jgi:hypothetical protein
MLNSFFDTPLPSLSEYDQGLLEEKSQVRPFFFYSIIKSQVAL